MNYLTGNIMTDNAYKEFMLSAMPLNWYEIAKILHQNANTLYNSNQGSISYTHNESIYNRDINNRPVFLLAGFSLENLIKAYLIYENPHYIKAGKLHKKILQGHRLSDLQKKCKKIPSPKRTFHIFKTLEAGLTSWARYPCSTSANMESDELTITPQLWDSYNSIFLKYSLKLESLLTKKWKGPNNEIYSVKFT